MKNRKIIVKDIRVIIGENYYFNEQRGAKTNELGMTKSQVIQLANEIAEYIEQEKE